MILYRRSLWMPATPAQIMTANITTTFDTHSYVYIISRNDKLFVHDVLTHKNRHSRSENVFNSYRLSR